MTVTQRKDLAQEYLRLKRLLGKYEKKVARVSKELKDEVLACGTPNENGTYRLQIGDLVAMAVHQVRRTCDEEAVKEFEKARPNVIITKKVGDVNRIKEFLDLGLLTQDEYGKLVRLTEFYPLQVRPGSAK